MAGHARSPKQRAEDAGIETPSQGGQEPDRSEGLTEDVRPGAPAEGAAEGHRSVTLNLPFVTAQFRAPALHVPSRGELVGAARGARSLLPQNRSALFYGGLAVTAAIGVIEWPVAAAIGVGTALASRGAANPEPRGEMPPPVEAADAGRS